MILDLATTLMSPRVIVPVVGGLSLVGGISVLGVGAAFYIKRNIDKLQERLTEQENECVEVFELPGKVPVLGHFLHIYELGEFNLQYFKEVTEIHPTVQFSLPFAPCFYWTSDPSVIKRILQTGFREGVYEKSPFMMNHFKDFLGKGIFSVSGDQWKSKRKMASNLFRHHNLRSYVSIFSKNSQSLVEVVRNIAARNDEVYQKRGIDFQDYFMRYTLDSFCEIGFGLNIKSIHSTESALVFQRAFDFVQTYSVERWKSGELWKVKEFFWRSPEFQHQLQLINSFVMNIINSRSEESEEELEEKTDLLSQLLLHNIRVERGEIEEEKITVEELRDWIMNFLIAGRDTTAMLLTWCTYLISKPENSKFYYNVLNEIEEIYSEDPTYFDDQSLDDNKNDKKIGEVVFDRITFESQKNQKELKKILQETLRLYPPVPVDGYEAMVDDVITTTNGEKIFVKKGTFVAYSAYTTHRQEYNFVDAEKFNPDRFDSHVIPFSFVPFHGGPRVCLGQDMAYIEAKILMTSMLANFQFELVGEVTPKQSVILIAKDGVRFHITPK